ncbi:hypothetical protein [Saccharopolyspora sp. 6V]|uniref:hypothetical protein n=1 Tax=Saccharopolyspora sp. 6V TaxID=2877239 RepID=UPI001CD5BA6F|nr:hypothetical protein [Saccharopolyspora sp. 6V]MCA1191664.1 hypothetical protein [Saccharopolyspora sp. 6V]
MGEPLHDFLRRAADEKDHPTLDNPMVVAVTADWFREQAALSERGDDPDPMAKSLAQNVLQEALVSDMGQVHPRWSR